MDGALFGMEKFGTFLFGGQVIPVDNTIAHVPMELSIVEESIDCIVEVVYIT